MPNIYFLREQDGQLVIIRRKLPDEVDDVTDRFEALGFHEDKKEKQPAVQEEVKDEVILDLTHGVEKHQVLSYLIHLLKKAKVASKSEPSEVAKLQEIINGLYPVTLKWRDEDFDNYLARLATKKDKKKREDGYASDDEAAASAKKIPIIKLPRYTRRLFLGEADFSYTASLLTKHEEDMPGLASSIVATELNDEAYLQQIYAATYPLYKRYLQTKGVAMQYGVDAQKLHELFSGQRFSRIHFNCPHDGSDFRSGTLPPIIAGFFQSASKLQKKGDRIYLVLPKVAGKDDFYQGYVYEIYKAAIKGGYKVFHKRNFRDKETGFNRYSGYEHCETRRGLSAGVTSSLREWVFEKCATNPTERKQILTDSPPRPNSVINYRRVKDGDKIPERVTTYCLPECKTDDDSSDYVDSDGEEMAQRSFETTSSVASTSSDQTEKPKEKVLVTKEHPVQTPTFSATQTMWPQPDRGGCSVTVSVDQTVQVFKTI